MSMETSKRFLAKATADELEEYEKWLKMDSNLAKMTFFSKENSANWVVLEKWHEYQLEGIRKQLGLDFDLFNQMLEQEPIPEPTDAELAAHAFLRKVLGK